MTLDRFQIRDALYWQREAAFYYRMSIDPNCTYFDRLYYQQDAAKASALAREAMEIET